MRIQELEVDWFENVVHAWDEDTGLDAYVAIHSTKLGPALGGLRIYEYASTEHAKQDALRPL